MKAPIILAVDTSDFDTAIALIENTKDSVSVYKLGLEFYLNFGSAGVSKIIERTGAEIFLDLEQVHLEVELLIGDIRKEALVNFREQ